MPRPGASLQSQPIMSVNIILPIVLAFGATAWARPELDFSNDRAIIGGENATIEDIPYAVAIEYRGQLLCTGTIISEKFILTAGHCVVNKFAADNLTVRVGSSFSGKLGVVHKVKRTVPHPLYKEERLDYDAGIVELTETIQFNKAAQPIPLVEAEPKAGDMARISGWGGIGMFKPPPQLQTLQIPIISREECKKRFGFDIKPRVICTFQKGKCAFNGDSGGPVVVDGKVVGAISFRSWTDYTNHPSGHSNLADPEIREFIRKETGL